MKVLQFAILQPWATLLMAISFLLAGFDAYGQFGNAISFSPSIEPEFAQVQVRARDNFSIYEKDALVRRVEERLFAYDEIASIYARSGGGNQDAADQIGTIQIELTEWDIRRTAAVLGEDIRTYMATIPGIDVQVQTAFSGPSAGKPISLRVRARNQQAQAAAVEKIRSAMDDIGGFTDVTNTRPLPGVEWRIAVNRSEPARFGADISTLGRAVQLLTRGITVTDYRPDDADGSVDINVRLRDRNRPDVRDFGDPVQ